MGDCPGVWPVIAFRSGRNTPDIPQKWRTFWMGVNYWRNTSGGFGVKIEYHATLRAAQR